MATPKDTEIESLCSKLAERMADDWDRHLIGGSWPTGPSLEELARLYRGMKRTVETGVVHKVQKPVWRGYRWRRVYDSDGKIGYDLVKETP